MKNFVAEYNVKYDNKAYSISLKQFQPISAGQSENQDPIRPAISQSESFTKKSTTQKREPIYF